MAIGVRLEESAESAEATVESEMIDLRLLPALADADREQHCSARERRFGRLF
jgi:hypothetical protein